MLKRTLAAAALLMLAASPAFASHCPREMAAIDAALANDPQISAEQMSQVKELRAEGEELHKAGKHEESLEALEQAKDILGI